MSSAPEFLAEDGGEFQKVTRLRRSDAAFFRGDHQLSGAIKGEAYKVEIIFRGSRRNRDRKSAVLETLRNESVD